MQRAPAVQSGPAPVPAGNLYDKYGSPGPLARRLVARFRRDVDRLLERAAPDSLLDVGCGEGTLTAAFAERLAPAMVVGIDLDRPALHREWAKHRRANLEYRVGDAHALEPGDGEFDLVSGIELLEHVRCPERALAEMARVARRRLLLSVPREPVWRAANLARGAYLRSLGNTPGHVSHWSRRAFLALLERHGELEATAAPPPWTIALVRLA